MLIRHSATGRTGYCGTQTTSRNRFLSPERNSYNSSLVSAGNRTRTTWTSIPRQKPLTQEEDYSSSGLGRKLGYGSSTVECDQENVSFGELDQELQILRSIIEFNHE